ncbi:hypothetical protein GWI33_022392 [Rhynchophorus ferrugineus]|uniref:Uncharacterized protein n=1 Tax=Rhynchophorus ferrugineus TaxID=354439 RepID=A0A834ISS1_RHYFE|nr:hypothetical protein GWI33_022392 [Rhynchophorus ferrugineus]
MNSKMHLVSSFLNNSLAIRQEIQRFESVHPSIYAIYDLLDMIPDGHKAQQIRDHVVCIEGRPNKFCSHMLVFRISCDTGLKRDWSTFQKLPRCNFRGFLTSIS